MSKTLADKIGSIVTVDEEQKAMGIGPKEVFNPLSGWVFNLKCYKKKENGITSYDNSEFIQLPNGRNIYTGKGDPITLRDADVKKTYSLKDMQKPESFKSYEEMTAEFDSQIVVGQILNSCNRITDLFELLNSHEVSAMGYQDSIDKIKALAKALIQ